jgi:phosphoserine phosphatase
MTTTGLRRVLHLSGKATDGVVTDFCELIAQNQGQLLHLSQCSVHGCLTLNAELNGQNDELLSAVRNYAMERGLHLEATNLDAPQVPSFECGIWVTVLGRVSGGQAIAHVTRCLRSYGFSLSKVETVGATRMVGVHLLATKRNLSDDEILEVRQALLEGSSEWKVDLAVQRDDVYRASKRLLCMDVDSTFVKGEFIDELAELIGVKAEVAEITAQAMRGELDFEAALRKRVALLEGLEMSRARELCDRFELTPGAGELVRTVKQLGMKVGLVSGGFDFFVESLRRKFGLDFAFANELEVKDGKLTGRVTGTIVDSRRKAQVLKDMAHVFDVRVQQTVAAGDGANDIEMLKAAGLGIAYQAKARLQQVADTRLNQNDRLDALLYLMGFDAHQLVGACA